MMRAYRKLNVWCKAMDLVDAVYSTTASFPKEENYALRSQIRRAVVSIPSNIAEGSQRNGRKEFVQFLSVAYASLAELETQIEIAHRQSYIKENEMSEIFNQTGEVGRMLNGLSASISQKLPTANRLLSTKEA